MPVGLMDGLDGDDDLVVRDAFLLELPGELRLRKADPAAGGVLVDEARQQRLVLEHRALGALAKAVEPVERGRDRPGDLVAFLDPGVPALLEELRIERRTPLLAGRAGVLRVAVRLALGGVPEERPGRDEESREGDGSDPHAARNRRRRGLVPLYLRLSMISSSAFRPGRSFSSARPTMGLGPRPESSRKSFLVGST